MISSLRIETSKTMRATALLLGVLVLMLDLSSKWWTQKHLPLSYYFYDAYPYGGLGVFKNFFGVEFSINHATNKGAAWGMLAEYQTPLLVLRIIFVAALSVYAFFLNKDKFKFIPFMLIIAGALGNILDYFIYGHVIDMFHFILWGYDYPVFNVADSAIFIGILWLFLLTFKRPLDENF